MAGVRLRLPHWTAHPGFGVAVLLALAIVLILHGEPQPSSRPSGTSVVVGSKTPSNVVLPSTLVIADGVLERRQGSQVRQIGLPMGELPLSVLTSGTLSVVLAVGDDHQRAYAISAALRVTDLGYADGVIPSTYPGASVVIERAVTDPGLLISGAATSSVNASGTASAAVTGSGASDTAGATTFPPATSPVSRVTLSEPSSADPSSGDPSSDVSSSVTATTVPPTERNYTARRYDRTGRPMGQPLTLLAGIRIAADTAEGLLAWRPAAVLTERGRVTGSLPATASLIRPDSSVRVIGAVHPLAATDSELLVWDLGRSEFGLMPLALVTATTTRTADPTLSASPADDISSSDPPTASSSPAVSVSPSTVAGTRWFQPSRGFVVTGPATFSPDGASFAAYGQVGNRRRLIVGRVADVGTDQIEVLALSQPTPASASVSGSVLSDAPSTGTASTATAPSSVVSVSGTVPIPTRLTPLPTRSSTGPRAGPGSQAGSRAGPGSQAGSTAGPASQPADSPLSGSGAAVSVTSDSPSASSSVAAGSQAERFGASAPGAPVWLDTLVVALAPDGAVIGYVPGHSVASVLDFGNATITSLAVAP